MNLTRTLTAVAVAATCITTVGCGGRADVSYDQKVKAEYTLLPTIAISPDAKSFTVEAPTEMDLATDKVAITGMQASESAADQADVRLRISGAKPTLSKAQAHQFNGVVYNYQNSQQTYPAFNYSAYWYTAQAAQKAQVEIFLKGNDKPVATKNISASRNIAFPAVPKTTGGMLQMGVGPSTLMEREPCSSPDAVINRANYLAQNFCIDIKPIGGMTSDAKGGQKKAYDMYSMYLAEFKDHNGSEMRSSVVASLNGFLKDAIATQDKKASFDLASIPDDPRFVVANDSVLKAATSGEEAHLTDAKTKLEAIANDPVTAPRVQAAAYYNLATAYFAVKKYDDAVQSLDQALGRGGEELEETMFDDDGSELKGKINYLRNTTKEIQRRQAIHKNTKAAPTA